MLKGGIAWLLLFPVIFIAVTSLIDGTFSYGELTAIGLTLIVGGYWLLRWRRSIVPFGLGFFEAREVSVGRRAYKKSAEIPLGQDTDLALRVETRLSMRIERLDVRFIQRKWTPKPWKFQLWEWENVSPDVVLMVAFQHPAVERDTERIGHKFSPVPNCVGGFFGDYIPPYESPEEDIFELKIKVCGKKLWNGHIGLQLRRGSTRKAAVRRTFRVVAPKTPAPDTQVSPP